MLTDGRTDFVRAELIVPEAERGPWFNPHPGAFENARRAVRPAAIACSLYLVVGVSLFLVWPSPSWALQSFGPIWSTAIAIISLSLSGTLFWFMARGSITAHILVLGLIPGSLFRISALASDGHVSVALAGAMVVAATAILWLISIIAITRHIWFRAGKLDP